MSGNASSAEPPAPGGELLRPLASPCNRQQSPALPDADVCAFKTRVKLTSPSVGPPRGFARRRGLTGFIFGHRRALLFLHQGRGELSVGTLCTPRRGWGSKRGSRACKPATPGCLSGLDLLRCCAQKAAANITIAIRCESKLYLFLLLDCQKYTFGVLQNFSSWFMAGGQTGWLVCFLFCFVCLFDIVDSVSRSPAGSAAARRVPT